VIPLNAGWADVAMGLTLVVGGIALSFAQAREGTTQAIALAVVRTTLWGGAFWELVYVTLHGQFAHLFDRPASAALQIGLGAALLVFGCLMLRGDRRWLITLTGRDDSLSLPRYILPAALSPVIGAYVIGIGARSGAYDARVAFLLNVEFVSACAIILSIAAVRALWRPHQARDALAKALQQSPVIVHSTDGKIEYWSEECERMFGFSAEEAIGRHTPTLLKTEYLQPLPEIVERLRAEGLWSGEVRHVTRDGQTLTIASRIAIHRLEGDKALKVVATMIDITDFDRVGHLGGRRS
jgi:PAS domain S-box-containing protein